MCATAYHRLGNLAFVSRSLLARARPHRHATVPHRHDMPMANTHLQVAGPPTFLVPEATRQRKVCRAHLQPREAVQAAAAASDAARTAAAKPFDVAKLAPKLKGTADIGTAVLSAPAKRARDPPAVVSGGAYGNTALVRTWPAGCAHCGCCTSTRLTWPV